MAPVGIECLFERLPGPVRFLAEASAGFPPDIVIPEVFVAAGQNLRQDGWSRNSRISKPRLHSRSSLTPRSNLLAMAPRPPPPPGHCGPPHIRAEETDGRRARTLPAAGSALEWLLAKLPAKGSQLNLDPYRLGVRCQ